jgi:hypothetical protein
MERLQRQRALLHEHLRWLESEIAAEASAPATTKVSTEPAGIAAPAASAPPAPVPASIGSEPAVEVPEADVRGIHSEVRSGCLLYFALAFVALGLAVGFIYWRY